MDSVTNYAPQIQTLARTILARINSGEVGMTIDWEGRDLSPINAYSIGGVTASLVVSPYALLEDATLALVQWLATNASHKAYAPIGAWLESGHLYFDLVTILPVDSGFSNAKAIGRARGELAIGEFDSHGCYIETHTL